MASAPMTAEDGRKNGQGNGRKNGHRTERWTSRVLLVDGHDRLLLLCGRDPRGPGARWWFTVGGGVEDGEDHIGAAVREIREETGLSLPAHRLGPLLWTRRAAFTVDDRSFDQHEEYRLVRVTDDEAHRVRIDPVEARHGHRWWSVRELATTEETVRPKDLARLLTGALTEPRPADGPVHLGDFDEETDPDSPAGRPRAGA
ncbi:NUDIX hydrolase [Streptomyces sp. NPDC059605]|uniref:NUDIX hydrolase n=2 Tax=Streptomyces TaxID=1883 RepID=UPI003692924D